YCTGNAYVASGVKLVLSKGSVWRDKRRDSRCIKRGNGQLKRRALSAALAVNGRGCFVPDLTRLAMPQCAGARRGALYRIGSESAALFADAARCSGRATACGRLQPQLLPDLIDPGLDCRRHLDGSAPLAAGFSRPFISRIDPHLAAESADR